MRPYLFENNWGKEWVRKFASTGKAKKSLPIHYLFLTYIKGWRMA
jgi:hypothetical protein